MTFQDIPYAPRMSTLRVFHLFLQMTLKPVKYRLDVYLQANVLVFVMVCYSPQVGKYKAASSCQLSTGWSAPL